ncbi:MAG TPA: methyltransferase domain-containing protein [Candidatus Acidoferrales bacterium]|nr:methyltransferase domain-containing protein [Candidatus Acidoferrales bacterium]
MASVQPESLYENRFAGISQHKRAAMWEVLCRKVLQPYVKATDTVVDLGAGFCEFINHIVCEHKVAIDANPAVREHAGSEVNVVVGDVQKILTRINDQTVNVVFCSNFFEHLANKDAVVSVLREIDRILVAGGHLLVIQPNIRYAYKEYWDFFDHHVPLSHHSFREAVELAGLQVELLRPRFLPYTTKSKLPQAAWLVHLYLAFRPAQWLFGKQMLVIARKKRSVGLEG